MANKPRNGKTKLDDLGDVVDARAVAEYLDLSVETIQGYARDGRLRSVRCGRKYRFKKEWILDFLEGAK